jgi:antitoxin (DNA-binding transcriptional repressor) of toxin-antitoxin stability system
MYTYVQIYVQKEQLMKTASFTEFRKHAAEFFDFVEKGEVVRILRHGVPIADITPVALRGTPSWKKVPPLLPLKGASLSKALLKNRKESSR